MPTKYQLRKGARHANYEMAMLHATAAWLTDGVQEPMHRPVLESWAAHLRNLIEFFHPTAATRKHSDTVLAEWYVKDPAAWARALKPLTKAQQNRRKALHTHLAHISYKRDGRKTRWHTRDHEIVASRLRLFQLHLSPARRAWFPNLLP
jgi:hypothetical protein